MGKPILAPCLHHGHVPFCGHRASYLKADPTTEAAIEFGLDQLLSAPKARAVSQPSGDRETHPIGASADRLLN